MKLFSASTGVALTVICLLTGFAVTQAADSSGVSSVLAAFKVSRENGKEQLVSAARAAPGDTIEYQLTLTNHTGKAITAIEPVLPIPAGSVYIEGSCKPAKAEASTDGKNFSTIPLVKQIKDSNGKEKTIKLPMESYKFIKWKVGKQENGKNLVVIARVKLLTAQPGVKTNKAKLR